MIRKYHYQLGLPTNRLPSGVISLTYSNHALSRAVDKGITLPAFLDTSTAKVIEIEVEDGMVEKILYRVKYNAGYDMLLAIIPYRKFVKTAWLNSVTDKHTTLNASEYDRPRS